MGSCYLLIGVLTPFLCCSTIWTWIVFALFQIVSLISCSFVIPIAGIVEALQWLCLWTWMRWWCAGVVEVACDHTVGPWSCTQGCRCSRACWPGTTWRECGRAPLCTVATTWHRWPSPQTAASPSNCKSTWVYMFSILRGCECYQWSVNVFCTTSTKVVPAIGSFCFSTWAAELHLLAWCMVET